MDEDTSPEGQDQDTSAEERELPPAAREAMEASTGAPPVDGVEATEDGAEPPVVEPAVTDEAEDPAADALAALAALEGRAPQAQQQASPQGGFDPRVLAEAVRTAVESSPQSRLVSEVLARQAQAAARPTPPPEPGPEATVADWQRYTAQVTDFAVRNAVGPLQQQMQQIQQTFGSQMQQIQETFRAQQQAAQQQQYRAALDGAVSGLAMKPSNAWLQKDPLLPELVKMAYERSRGHGLTLEQVVESVGRAFGAVPATPAVAAQQNRAASTTALAAKRAQVRNSPVRPAAGGKAPAKVQTNEERLRKNGAWDALPDDLKEYNRMMDRRAVN